MTDKVPQPTEDVSRRIERWLAPRWIPVQIWCAAMVGLPWALGAAFGMRWAWLSLAVAPLAVYVFVGAAVVRDLEDIDADAKSP